MMWIAAYPCFTIYYEGTWYTLHKQVKVMFPPCNRVAVLHPVQDPYIIIVNSKDNEQIVQILK